MKNIYFDSSKCKVIIPKCPHCNKKLHGEIEILSKQIDAIKKLSESGLIIGITFKGKK
ncbi:MAG: hypothetical protein PHX21_13775 [bacterium]|nr:hypothetical protein [bacterium]